MFGFKPLELLMIVALVFFLFGGSRLPALGAGIGDAIRGFKRGVNDADEKPEAAASKEPPKKA